MDRLYSLLTIKSIDDDARVIEGVASTPVTDRAGDVVVSEGAKFALPIPLLWMHRTDQPIGHVVAASAGADGIKIRAQIAKGLGIARIDEAWQLVKAGLVRGLSIGFRATEDPEPIKGTFGLKFNKWEWLELSVVSIPANSDANIQLIKSLDGGVPQPGSDADRVRKPSAAAVASTRVVQAIPIGHSMKKTYTEQIREFENTRAAKTARMDEIMEKAADETRSLEEKEKEEYDRLQKDVDETDEHLVRLRAAEERNKAAAKPVQAETQHAASQSRSPHVISVAADNREKGIGFARVLMAKMGAFVEGKQGNFISALDLAKAWWPSDPGVHRHIEESMRHKTAVAGATSQAATYAGFLVYADNLTSEFIEYLRPQTIIGKFGMNGVPSLRRVPFNVRIPRSTGGFTGYWVGEGKAKPLSAATGDTVTLTYTKVAAIAVITQELARFSSPSAEAWVRDELAKAVIERIDRDFIDPAKAASSYVNPASITNGLTALTSAGTTADSVRTDVQNLLEQYILNNLDPTDLVLIMPNTLAMVLSIMVNTLGQREFPNMSISGGSLLGIPVIASQYAASGASYGNMIIAVKANDVALADDGRVQVDVSGEASLQMDDAPTNDSTTGTGASVVSMFQTNSLAVRAEREIHWAKLRSTAVVYMDDVNWGAIGSPF